MSNRIWHPPFLGIVNGSRVFHLHVIPSIIYKFASSAARYFIQKKYRNVGYDTFFYYTSNIKSP